MNLNAIAMADINNNSEVEVEGINNYDLNTVEKTKDMKDENDLALNCPGGIYNAEKIAPEKLIEIQNNMRNSNLGHLFTPIESNNAPSSIPEPMAPSQQKWGNIKINHDYGTDSQYQPSIAIGPLTGNIYITWLDDREYNTTYVYFAKSTDNGKSFEGYVHLNRYQKTTPQTPVIAVNSTESIYVVWSDDRASQILYSPKRYNWNYDIFLNKSDDGGDSWLGADIWVNNAHAFNQTNPTIAVSNDDMVFVAWEDELDFAAYWPPYCKSIQLANSTDGEYFYPRKKVSGAFGINAVDPALAVDNNDYVWVTWSENNTAPNDYDIYYTRTSTPWPPGATTTFNTEARVDASPDGYNQNNPDIVVRDDNNAYIVWEDERSGLSADTYIAKYNTVSSKFLNEKRINNDPGDKTDQLEPHIALPTSGNNVYVTWRDERNGYYETYFARSENKASTFIHQAAIDDDFTNLRVGSMVSLPPDSLKSIAVHTDGTIYISYAENRFGNFDIFLQKSTTMGNSWSNALMVNDNGTSSMQSIDNKYDIGIGDDDVIHVAWMDTRENYGLLESQRGDIYYSHSSDYGLTFSQATRVNKNSNGIQKNPSIAVNQSDEVYISWTDLSASPGEIFFTFSLDGGQSFVPSSDIKVNGVSTINDNSCIAVNSSGVVFIAYEGFSVGVPPNDFNIYVSFSDYSGSPPFFTFSTHKQVNFDVPSLDDNQISPAIAIDQSIDYIYVVWEDYRNETEQRPDIYFAKSMDSGLNYGTNVAVNLTGGTTTRHVTPAIAVKSDGNISVVWAEEQGGNYDIRWAKSTNYGTSFGSYEWVNSVTTNDQTNPRVAISDSKNIYVTWQDAQNGDLDIYMAILSSTNSSFTGRKRVDDDSTGFGQMNPSIAVLTNVTDQIFIVWSDLRDNIHKVNDSKEYSNNANNYNVYLTRSTNTGSTFSKNYCIQTYESEPAIAVDNNGTVYTVWVDTRFGSGGDIFFAKSYVSGQHFNANKRIYSLSYAMDKGRASPDMVIRQGILYIVWEEWALTSSDDTTIVFCKSTDGGASFTAPVDITPGRAGNQANPALAVDRTGNIHVVWQDNIPGPSREWDIYYSNSTNGGTLWSSVLSVNPQFGVNKYINPCINVDNSATTPIIYIAYERSYPADNGDIYLINSTDGGVSFNAEFNLTDDGGYVAQHNPAMDVDSTGVIAAVWDELRGPDRDIYFTISRDKANTFSVSKIVNSTTGDEQHPDIVIDPSNNNNIMVMWQSDRDTTPPDDNFNIWNATSLDGGITYFPATRVDDTGSEIQDQIHPKLAIDSTGSLYSIWEDYRHGNGDIYSFMMTDHSLPLAEAGSTLVVPQGEYGNFIAAGTKDNFGIYNYTWTFNDMGPQTLYEYNTKYLFNTPGNYLVTLTVTDYYGNQDIDTLTVTVSDLTPPILLNDQTTGPAYTGNSFTFKIDVTDFAISKVKVEYWYGTKSGTPPNVTMQPGVGNQYTKPIPVADTLELLNYQFYAEDLNTNWKIFIPTSPITVIDDDNPEIKVNATSSSAFTGSVLTFSIQCDDNIDVSSGWVNFRYGTSGTFTIISLIKGTTYYTNTTTIAHTLTPLYYYFSFVDTSDNWNTSSTGKVTIIDNIQPELVQDNSDLEAFTEQKFNFSMQFTDNVATDSAYVDYSFTSSRASISKTLIQSGDDWEASIMIPSSLGKLKYKFYFNDTTIGNTNSTIEVQIDIQDIKKPTAVTGSGDIDATTGEGFEIFAKFSDNIGISKVKVYYSKVATSSWLMEEIATGVDGNYSITNDGMEINTSTDATNWEYYFFAEDTSENNITYGTKAEPYTIDVKDNDKPVADAGDDITVDVGAEVTFDGKGSTDNIGITKYTWTFQYTIDKETMTGEEPKFTFTVAGSYVVTLNVSDLEGYWDTDTVKVDVISDIPLNVTLDRPGKGGTFSQTTVTLGWHTVHPDANQVKFDVYWGTEINPPLKETKISATTLELTGLTDKTTYYWKVKPWLGTTSGTVSEIRSFRIDLEFEPEYDVDITAETTDVYITVGNTETVKLTITNKGTVDDIMNLDLDVKNYPDDVELSLDNLFLTLGESMDVNLTIKTIESTPIGTYSVEVTASSASATGDVSKSVTIKIHTIEKIEEEKDKDGDGLPDEWEEQYFGDITSYGAKDDPDNDNILNIQEYLGKTDPTKADVTGAEDSDGDNLPDQWEIDHFGGITQYGKDDDPDNDGISNYDEYQGGTNPLDKKDDKKDDEADYTMAIVGIVVAIIIVVLLLLFLMMKKKKGGEPEEGKEDSTPGAPTGPVSGPPTTPVSGPYKPPVGSGPGGPGPAVPPQGPQVPPGQPGM